MTLPTGVRIYLDTNIFIYLVEGHPGKSECLTQLNQKFEEGLLIPVSSTLTLAECVVKPLKEANKILEQQYLSVFANWGKLEILSISDSLLMEAVRIRAKFGLGLLDAIHAASAVAAGCQTILSSDRMFQRFKDLSVINLEELV